MEQRHFWVVTQLVSEHLAKEGEAILQVTSESMSPLIRINDLVRIRNVSAQDLRCGDIVVIQKGDEYITHRYLEKQGKMWLTRGDNLVLPDPPIHENQYIGKVVEIQREGWVFDLSHPRWVKFNHHLGWLSLANIKWIKSIEIILRRYTPHMPQISINVALRVLSFPFSLWCNLIFLIEQFYFRFQK